MTRRSAPTRRAVRGFSMIELLVVMAVIGLLAGLAIPRYRDMKRRAASAAVMGDFSTVRVAAYNYFADSGKFAGDAGPGSPPPGLVPYLPMNFEFSNATYTLDYDTWSDPGGVTIMGVTVTSDDQALVHMIARNVKAGTPGLLVGNSFTYILTGL